MKREVITTKDGSKTIHLPEWNENYHSHHGAYQEAMHVFINSGLKQFTPTKKPISVLEIGFGTGLNALLTFNHTSKNNPILYTGLEAYPVNQNELDALNYTKLDALQAYQSVYQKMHTVQWNEWETINSHFKLLKLQKQLEDFNPENETFDLIYFDAFGPRVQPDLWSLAVFETLFRSMKKEGIFVTYCCKGQVRRDLIQVGFEVEKIPGPPGKREMLRAFKRE